MSMDLTGITNQNEYYTNHYFSSIFEENASETISKWRAEAKDSEEIRTPWALLRDAARQYYPIHDRFLRSKFDTQTLGNIRTLADIYLSALGYPEASPEIIDIDDATKAPVYLELKKPNGAPALWVLLATSEDKEAAILDKFCFSADSIGEEGLNAVSADSLTAIPNEDLVTKILFGQVEPPRFIILIGMNQIALIDRNKWNEKRYLQFELEEIFSRHEESTLQAMAVLLHRSSLCPEEGTALLDTLDANSQKHAAGVSQDLKYALRECIELLGNEVLYDMAHRQGRDLNADPVDAGELTIECLRYMYRMLFVLFIEARPELGYAPIKAQAYLSGYSLESLRDIADDIRDDVTEVGGGYYLHETLSKLYDLIYNGYPATEEEILKYSREESLHDMFVIAPLKAHIFDPEYTKMITAAKLRNSVMLRIIDLMSLTRETGRRNDRRGRISYANLGINQMGSVYEALLSYRGFIAEHTLYEVKRAGDSFNELDVGYFVSESELNQYAEDERVRYDRDDPAGRYKKDQLRKYEKGTFIYRLAGREREKSASYYTPEVLTKCLVKYALKELLEGKTADEILHLTVCEPAMGSAAFLNEAISQLAEAYLDRRQKELGEMIPAEKRQQELQKVKMYIADNNVYGIDLNPVAVELAEVSLWLNTIYEGGFVPWFGTQLVNGNSLIGARRQCYRKENLLATSKGLRWFENAPERVGFSKKDKNGREINPRGRNQIYHFLLGDPGMCSYSDKVIKSLEPENIKLMTVWSKQFSRPYTDEEFTTLQELSKLVDAHWKRQIAARKTLEEQTRNALNVYGHNDHSQDSRMSIREKDKFLHAIYKSEHSRNAGSYARLKFAMDYWCALWFWPIAQAELLPKRSEFLNDMDLILRGVVETSGAAAQPNLSLFEDEAEETEVHIEHLDLDMLCNLFPRLALVREIAEQNHFMHWELEFADLFAERGGFDLVIGNPPWIKITWNEQGVLSDKQPMFAIKKLSANETTKYRNDALQNLIIRDLYFSEFESMTGEQAFLNAVQNYNDLKGQQTNLFKCFLPQAWQFNSERGVSAFIHPEGVYDDPKGGALREKLYARLRKHFMFANERKLFPEVDHHTTFSLNVYGGPQTVSFDTICNLYDASSIAECYEGDGSKPIPEIKDENGDWNTQGHPDRLLQITKRELTVFAKLFDGGNNWKGARLPVLHTKEVVNFLVCISEQKDKIADYQSEIAVTQMWDETNAQKNDTIQRKVHFPETPYDLIYSGPHIFVGNPLFKCSRRECKLNSDYDNVDLVYIPAQYFQRVNYSPKAEMNKYSLQLPDTAWGTKVNDTFRVLFRRMLNLGGERTLIGAIVPPRTGHVSTMISVTFSDLKKMLMYAGLTASLPYDAFVKILGKGDMYLDTIIRFPFFAESDYQIIVRTLMLNALTDSYKALWEAGWNDDFLIDHWAKKDERLFEDTYSKLTKQWNAIDLPRSDYARRQIMVELDVLVARKLGLSLDELKVIYRIQFPIMRQYEADTWYDANGRIAFTTNRSLIGVGFTRPEWENGIKGAPAGQKFYRTIIDDTLPGGPVERTIEYVAPFDRCDREQDYETAWKFFKERYC
ncbi:MAG: class I SAM-dependent DNA methyltransferase [Acidaminococcaceae bacterium]|nr:class I SAM-dependent DNA methyltransferase [Acidaminococcaceae bacterium]